MLKRISPIVVIFLLSTLAWVILASSISSRTSYAGDRLRPDLISSWGTAQQQVQPIAMLEQLTPSSPNATPVTVDAERSRIHTELTLEYRQKGLLWYSTYVVRFDGAYMFRNNASEPRRMILNFPLPAQEASYDDLRVVAASHALPFSANDKGAYAAVAVPAGETVEFQVGYRSRGLDSWRYNFGKDVKQIRDFDLMLTTNFRSIDFPAATLSPVSEAKTSAGWELDWRYQNLISGLEIGMTMPQKLQPGPLAGEISLFAPVSLLLFFFVLFIVTTLRRVDLHPMNYFFLAASFFAFHLLMAYLVDHISIEWAFVWSSLVSVGLVVSYLRLIAGPRFAIKEAGLAQFVYLVLFSFSFFLKGFTGIAITIGCVVTLFVTMQLTARVRWHEQFVAPTERR